MAQLAVENFLLQNGVVSLSKAAMLCSMVENELDDDVVEWLSRQGVSVVITRAGGSGDNLKNKILRNTFGAAENSGLVPVNMKNRHVISQLVEGVLTSFDGSMMSIIGGGLKIGLAVRKTDIAIGIFGSIGLPGLDIDHEISASRVLYHCLEG